MVGEEMELAVVGLRGLPDVIGGIETHCEELYPRVSLAAGPDLKITVLARRPYSQKTRFQFRGVDVLPLPSIKNRYFETITHTILAVLVARFGRAKMIHIHAIGPGLCVPFAKLLGMRVIHTHHGEDYNRAKWGRFASALLRAGEYVAVRFSDEVIVVSRSVAKRLRQRFPGKANNIHYVPNGVAIPPTAAADNEVLTQHELRKGSYVLGIGRLVPEKGFHDLVAAYTASGLEQRGVSLVIAGDALHESEYSAGLQSDPPPGVNFCGRLPRNEVLALCRNASLFVLPSYHEGLSIAGLEALMVGAPVLFSDIEPNTDLGLPSHNYFPVGDVSALAQKLAEPHAAYLLGTREFLAEFDWDDIARQTLAIMLGSADRCRLTEKPDFLDG